ncbi:MAG TPA: hypothetical protein VGB34_02865 [Candidatus Limnocylindria bacterium]
MIIWRRWGILVAVLLFGGLVVAQLVADAIGGKGTYAANSTMYAGLGLTVGGAGMTKRKDSTENAVEETVHYGNGGIRYTGFLLKGEMHGAWSWYRTDGSLMRTGEFDRGKQVGTWRTLDRSGKVVKETDFGR